jgi:hypothetical protein
MRRSAVVFAGVLGALLIGGYIALDRMAQTRVEESVAAMQARLPEGSSLTYTRLTASFLTRGASLHGVVLQYGPNRIRADELDISGARKIPDRAAFGADSLRVTGFSAKDAGRRRILAEELTLEDVVLSKDGKRLERLGRAESPQLLLGNGPLDIQISGMDLADWDGRRLGRFEAEAMDLKGFSRRGEGEAVLRDLAVTGLVLPKAAEVPQPRMLEPEALSGLISRLRSDSLSIGTAKVTENGTKKLSLSGLATRDKIREDGTRVWTTEVDRFAVRTETAWMHNTGLLDENMMLRGRLSARQALNPTQGTYALSPFEVEIDGGGHLAGTARFSGIETSGQESGATRLPAPKHLWRVALAEADITYRDAGLMEDVVAGMAAAEGVKPQALVAARLQDLREAAENASPSIRKSVAALETFLNEGGQVHLTAAPDRTIPISRIALAFALNPILAAEGLNLQLEHERACDPDTAAC